MREAMGSGNVCAEPLDIQVVTVDGEVPALETGDIFKTMKKDKGFICLNSDQVRFKLWDHFFNDLIQTSEKCMDYKVRYLCPQLNIPMDMMQPRQLMQQGSDSISAEEYSQQLPTQPDSSSNNSSVSNARAKQVNLEGLATAYGLCKQHGMCCEESTFFEDFVINNQ